ncbi:MAG: Vps62-related protein [Candidatus Zixiibacteriota bacterium]
MKPPFDLETVVQRFAPLVRLHLDEHFQPSSVEWYLARTELWHVSSAMHARRPPQYTKLLSKGDVTVGGLVSQKVDRKGGRDESGGESQGLFFLRIPHDPHRRHTCQGSLTGAQCYGHVMPTSRSNLWQIAYLFFFPFNGSIVSVDSIAHEGDWEHIKVEIDTAAQAPLRVYYAAHGGGDWHNKNTRGSGEGFYCFQKTHPIVYSAWHSHASYPRPGVQERALASDETATGGAEWPCWERTAVLGDKANPPSGQEWLRFNGLWGDPGSQLPGIGEATKGPTGPAFKKWWKDNGFDT